MTSASSMHEAGHPELVLWDHPEGWGGEGGGWGVQRGWTQVYPWLIHADVWKKNHNIESNYPPIKVN